jgi:hypothetical protein
VNLQIVVKIAPGADLRKVAAEVKKVLKKAIKRR